MDQAGFLSARSPLIFRRSIRVPKNPTEEVMRGDFIASPCHLETPKVDVGLSLHPRVPRSFHVESDLALQPAQRFGAVCSGKGNILLQTHGCGPWDYGQADRSATDCTSLVFVLSLEEFDREELHGTVYDGCVATYTLDVISYCKCVFRVFTDTV